jgi:fluoroacetyl-CoA thioesterase
MKDSLKPGLTFEYKFTVPKDKTVPLIYPEIQAAKEMPKVFATGFMVGLVEFACIEAINPHIDWPSEQTVGIQVNLNHTAATPPGFTVTVKGKLEKVDGRKLRFLIEVDDGVDKISEGTHDRFVIDADKFNAQVEAKSRNLLG